MSSQTSESTAVFDFVAWLEVNKKRLAIGAGVLVAAGFIYAGYQQSQQARVVRANEALIQVSLSHAKRDGKSRPSAGEYLKVAETYPNTTAGDRAALLAAGALFGEGKFTEAKAQFDQVLAKQSEGPLAATAAYGAASCLDSMNQLDAAITAYQKVITAYPTSSEATQAKLALAAIHEEKGKPDEALKIYNELAPATSDITRMAMPSGFSGEASARRELLFKNHPELAPAPAAKPSLQNLGLPPNVKITPVAPKEGPAPAPAPVKQ